MRENLNIKITVAVLAVVATFVWIFPNFVNTSKFWWPTQEKLAYGLDIQGGLHLVLGIEVNNAIEARLKKLGQTIKSDLLKEKKVTIGEVEVTNPAEGRVKIFFDNPKDKDAVKSYMEDTTLGQGRVFQTLSMTDKYYEGRFFEAEITTFKKGLVDRTIETIRNRIDEFGVKEPSISAQSDSRILVQLPGVDDSDTAKELVNRTAKLEFMIVDPEFMPGTPKLDEVAGWIREVEEKGGFALGKDDLRYSEYVKKINEALVNKLPKNRVIRFEKADNAKSLEAGKIPYVLETDKMMGGETLNDAAVSLDQLGQPIVVFSFDAQGAKEFGELTTANVKKLLAIVLDGVVQTAPNLREPITGGRGQIEMGGTGDRQKTMNDANLTAMVLRSGALPAELEQLEERTVGPTLGKDSIDKGKFAGLVGAVLVFVFMLIYYRTYGVIADIALALNILMIIAILTALQATLTLPGVAGIVLTIGMAVDANIIIYERIKEELAKGAGLMGAINEGYARAFTAILDSNITTVAVAVVLMYFGTGPIRGFAVTLIVGIITTMFCAIFVTKTIFDVLVGKFKWNLKP